VLTAAAAIVVLSAVGGTSGHARTRPPLQILRGPPAQVEANLKPVYDRIARRVEKLRGLRFDHVPHVVVMSERRLATLGRSLARHVRARELQHPSRQQANHQLQRASIDLDQLAGLLPSESGLGPDARTSGLDRIGGAYDYPRHRIIIVPARIYTRVQLDTTLAHEMTHALEDQHFNLQLGRLTAPTEAAEVRRAVTEGTATYIQNVYRHRYLDDNVPVAQRIATTQGVIDSQHSPYAVSSQAIFDYVDGGLFVSHLHHQASGFRLVDRAIRHPPRRTDEILHPRTWPGAGGQKLRARPVKLGVAPLLSGHWRPVGGGTAGEERALTILLAGTWGTQASIGASGWDGGRFTVWRPRACSGGCDTGRVGVIAFRWRHGADSDQFAVGVPAYLTLGLLADQVTSGRLWEVDGGFVALGSQPGASALAFAPTKPLALEVSRRAAMSAARGGR
jgi:hypothetical protein